MDSQVTPLKKIQQCLENRKSFVLQGGAGCGKTETLKQTLLILSKGLHKERIACITHTNLAVNEIIDRVGEGYNISTTHSFISSLIKNYTKAIHSVISEVFSLKKVEVETEHSSGLTGNELKKKNHDNYKKAYKRFARFKYIVKGDTSPKELGKREYEKAPDEYNRVLNAQIGSLNDEVRNIIKTKNHRAIRYNDSRFDNFREFSYGHDSLLTIASLLFRKYPKLGRILCDKYDYILIDEYQDTHRNVIDIFLNQLPDDSQTTIGLFGDAMQSIYSEGIGDVRHYIGSGDLVEVPKEDNYRCSTQVINFVNALRDDDLRQKPAFKIKDDGTEETLNDRQGEVKLLYAVWGDRKPSNWSTAEDKRQYLEFIDKLIDKADGEAHRHTKLMLTNKSIASKMGFATLYGIFSDRYDEVKEEIERVLASIQVLDLAELCDAYSGSNKRYNYILAELMKAGLVLNTLADKDKVVAAFRRIVADSPSIAKALETAFEEKILKKSESYLTYIERMNSFLAQLQADSAYQEFKKKHDLGFNSEAKMLGEVPGMTEEMFYEFNSALKKETFYEKLFSEAIKFDEVIIYYRYLNEECDYITMHKTKGTGIENVMVVLDEYFWNQYNFEFRPSNTKPNTVFAPPSMKLFYVACSRTIKNLTVVKVVTSDEEKHLLETFPAFQKVVLN